MIKIKPSGRIPLSSVIKHEKHRVGIDFHVVDGKFQGSRTHVLELFAQVIRLSPDIDFYLFLDKTTFLEGYDAAYRQSNVRLISMPHANPIKRLMWQLPLLQLKYRLDLLHTQYILPLPSLTPAMVTIHDLLFETHPQYFEVLLMLRSKLLMRWAAYRAKHVFTVSEYSKAELERIYKVEPERVSVTTNAVDSSKFFPGVAGKDMVTARGLESGNYILTVGRIEPRKNHLTLLRAYSRMPVDTPPLVIVGQRDFQFTEVFNLICESGLENRVRVIEDIRDEELPAFYRHAKCFVYPSFAEGFGMPPLEAMASGVPVISSNTTALTEVVADAGLLIDPLDETQITDTMRQVLNDADLRRGLVEKGLRRASDFSWSQAATEVRAAYLKHIDNAIIL